MNRTSGAAYRPNPHCAICPRPDLMFVAAEKGQEAFVAKITRRARCFCTCESRRWSFPPPDCAPGSSPYRWLAESRDRILRAAALPESPAELFLFLPWPAGARRFSLTFCEPSRSLRPHPEIRGCMIVFTQPRAQPSRAAFPFQASSSGNKMAPYADHEAGYSMRPRKKAPSYGAPCDRL